MRASICGAARRKTIQHPGIQKKVAGSMKAGIYSSSHSQVVKALGRVMAVCSFLAPVLASQPASAIGGTEIIETTDLPDDLGVSPSGPATTFLPGVNRLVGGVSFARPGTPPAVFDSDRDEVLFEILPGFTLEQLTVISRGFQSAGDVSNLEIQTSVRDSDDLFPEPNNSFVLAPNQPRSLSFATDLGPGTYIARVGIGVASIGPSGTANADYTIEYTVTAVPEPGALALLAPALLALVSARRPGRFRC